VFLHRVEPGAADRSYGIHVGRLAGLPRGVFERAGEILYSLEATDSLTSSGPTWAQSDGEQLDVQLDLHSVLEHPLVSELRERHVDELTPLEALNLVSKWKAEWGSDPIDGD